MKWKPKDYEAAGMKIIRPSASGLSNLYKYVLPNFTTMDVGILKNGRHCFTNFNTLQEIYPNPEDIKEATLESVCKMDVIQEKTIELKRVRKPSKKKEESNEEKKKKQKKKEGDKGESEDVVTHDDQEQEELDEESEEDNLNHVGQLRIEFEKQERLRISGEAELKAVREGEAKKQHVRIEELCRKKQVREEHENNENNLALQQEEKDDYELDFNQEKEPEKEKDILGNVCMVCEFSVTSKYMCIYCSNFVHRICSVKAQFSVMKSFCTVKKKLL